MAAGSGTYAHHFHARHDVKTFWLLGGTILNTDFPVT